VGLSVVRWGGGGGAYGEWRAGGVKGGGLMDVRARGGGGGGEGQGRGG